MKGLTAGILESKQIGNCSNSGISSRIKAVTIVGEIPKIFEADEKSPAVKIVRRMLCGRIYLHAEPIESIKNGNVGYMMGGCFIWSSDSRFPSDYPIPLHDRQETSEQNEILSR